MVEAPKQSPNGRARTIAVHASPPFSESLKVGLDRTRLRVLTLKEWQHSDEEEPEALDLVLAEAYVDDDLLVEALSRRELISVPVVCIGEVNAEFAFTRPAVHLMPAETPVAEVIRVINELLFGESLPESLPPSAPSGPVSVLPRRSDRSVSQSPVPFRSPASLLPSPSHQSSNPPRLRSTPAGPASGAGRLLDDVGGGPQQLSQELVELLAAAEQRAKEELAVATEALGAPRSTARLDLSDEVLTALDAPIGESEEESVGLELVKSAGVYTEREAAAVRDDATEAPTSSVMGSAAAALESPVEAAPVQPESPPDKRPTSPPRRSRDTGIESDLASIPAATPPELTGDHVSRTRPPRTGSAATQRAATPLPKAPPLPKDAWVEKIKKSALPEPTRPSALESLGPQTSRSAQPGPPSEPPPRPPPPPAKSSTVSTTIGHEDERLSTMPPSSAYSPSTSVVEQAVPEPVREERGAAPEQPTIRPSRRRDTAPPIEVPRERPPRSLAAERPPPLTPRSERPLLRAPEEPPLTTLGQPPPTETEAIELSEGDAVWVLANAIQTRFGGAITFESDEGIRRVALRDGDLVTAASGIANESLVSYLVFAGLISEDVQAQLGHRLPSFGRHAGAALIAGGHLPQDQLWPTLRAHAEFIVGRALSQTRGVAAMEVSVPERLQAEPSVFGGATGSEVLVEIVRRVLDPDVAVRRLGGEQVRLHEGPNYRLLEECALSDGERQALSLMSSRDLGDLLSSAPSEEYPCVLYALKSLGIIEVERAHRATSIQKPARDPLDDEALRRAILARRALVENGDYFAVLGVPRSATGYHIRRAFLELRRSFEPSTILRAGTLELKEDIETIVEVLDEAYQVLKDPLRRDRYRRALEAVPPQS